MPFKSYSGGGGGYLQAAKRYNVKGQPAHQHIHRIVWPANPRLKCRSLYSRLFISNQLYRTTQRHGKERQLEADGNDIWDLPVIAFNTFDILRSTEKFKLEVVSKF